MKHQDTPREDYFDDYWDAPPKKPASANRPMTESERERYYARRDAYYAERDAYYAERDSYYANRDDEPRTVYYTERASKKERRTNRRRKKRHFLRNLILLLLAAGVVALLMGTAPVGAGTGERLADRSTVLVGVADTGSGRMDAVLLLTLEQHGHVVRALELPTDMCSEDGLTRLEDCANSPRTLMRVSGELLGFVPDAYLIVDAECISRTAALVNTDGAALPETAAELPGLLKKLVSGASLSSVPELWRLWRTRTETDLSPQNCLWAARVLVKANVSAMENEALPGRLVETPDGVYRTVDRDSARNMLRRYSPFV